MSTTTIRDLFGAAQLRLEAGVPPVNQQGPASGGGTGGGGGMQDDGTGMGPQMPPEVASAPYIKLLTKLGYEYQGGDEDMDGNSFGQSFTGSDGDSITVKPDGSWSRTGPGATRAQGKSVQDLGQALVKDTLQQGDDQNHHYALRQAGYNKVHTDAKGTSYYKHPQTGKTVHVTKDGNWGSSIGTGRGASKLRDFLGNEQLEDTDPVMQQNKLKQGQMKQQAQQQKQQQRFGKLTPGTRGTTGTRGPAGGGAGGGMSRGGF
jgi:hypothetical protein